MALPRLLLQEFTSFDHHSAADVPNVDNWDGSVVSMVTGHAGTGQAISSPSVNYTFGDDDYDLIVIRAKFRPTSLSTERSIFQIRDILDEIALKITTGGILKVQPGGVSPDGPWTSSAHDPLVSGTWYDIEFGVRVHSTAGQVRVKLNGVLLSDLVLDGVNTHGAGSGLAGRATIINPDGDYDEFYLYLGNGALQSSDLITDVFGNPKVATLYPAAGGIYNQWSGGGIDQIDEATGDGDNTRLEAVGPGSAGIRHSWRFDPVGSVPETAPDPPEGPPVPQENPTGLFTANVWDDRFSTKPVQAQGKYLYSPSEASARFSLLSPGRLQAEYIVGTSSNLRSEIGWWDPDEGAQIQWRHHEGEEFWYGYQQEIPSNWVQSVHKTVISQWHPGDGGGSGANPQLSVEVVNNELRFVRSVDGNRSRLATVGGAIGKTWSFVFHAKWAKTDAGFWVCWLNGQHLFTFRGPTLYADETEGTYWRMGLYLPGVANNNYPTGFTRRIVMNYLLLGDQQQGLTESGGDSGEVPGGSSVQSIPGGILGVQTAYQLRSFPTNNASARAFLRVRGIDVDAADRSLTTAYKYRTTRWPINPVTNDGWLAKDLNAADAGIRRSPLDASIDVRISHAVVLALHLDTEIQAPIITIPSGLLDQRTHRLSTLWRIQRASDGFFLYFTDHNASILFEGNLYEPASGLGATARRKEANLREANTQVRGIVASASLTEADLRSGRYRDSIVTEYLVDWKYPWAGAIDERTYRVQEVAANGQEFVAELGGIAATLKRRVGDVYTRTCRHKLGDNRCTVPIADFTRFGLVVDTVISKSIFIAGIAGLSPSPANDYFAFGELRWTRGANEGLATEVQSYVAASRQFTLQLPAEFTMAPGDRFDAEAGCNKLFFSDCLLKFNNTLNHGGFPYIPGVDKVLQTPNR